MHLAHEVCKRWRHVVQVPLVQEISFLFLKKKSENKHGTNIKIEVKYDWCNND